VFGAIPVKRRGWLGHHLATKPLLLNPKKILVGALQQRLKMMYGILKLNGEASFVVRVGLQSHLHMLANLNVFQLDLVAVIDVGFRALT
jgi:hypothetical protein